MELIVQELQNIIEVYTPRIRAISDREFNAKPEATKWSKIEVLGHLIDSAQNNLRRFICGQYETPVAKIVYDQDFWVYSNNYEHANKSDVVELWRLLNVRICEILTTMPGENYSKECDSGKQSPQLHSLLWFADDYVKHLKHHVNQIIPGSFDILYE